MGHNSQDHWKTRRMPEWKQRLASFNPPSGQRRLWRQEYRNAAKVQLRENPEGFQPFPHNRVIDLWDWY